MVCVVHSAGHSHVYISVLKFSYSRVEFEDEVESIFQFDDDLFQEVKDRVKQTKFKKKLHNRQRFGNEQRHGLEMNGEEFKEAQQTDETRDGVRETGTSRDCLPWRRDCLPWKRDSLPWKRLPAMEETACHGGETACHGGETAKP